MERRLETAVDLLEILMNFLLLIGLETVADAAVTGGATPVYVLLIPLSAPVLFYLFRRFINNLPLFLLAHIAVAAALCWLGGFCPVPLLWRIAFAAVGVIYIIVSLQVRLKKQEDGEGENAAGFMGVAAVAAFFACSYFKSETGGARILWLVLLWLAGHWTRSYLANFLGYLQMNRRAAGAMPEKRIFQGGIVSAAVYGVFSIVVLTLCSRAALLDRMSEIVKKAGLFLLRAFVKFLALFGSETQSAEEAQIQESAGMQQMMLPKPEDAPWWMALLDEIVITAVTIAVIVALVMAVVMLIRLMIQSFYGRKKEKREIYQEGYVEEEERLEKKKSSSEKKIPVIGGTPQQRVRRLFKKTVWQIVKDAESAPKGSAAANSRLLLDMSEIRKMEEEEKEGKKPVSGTDGLHAKTARELAALCAKVRGISGEGREEWGAFAALYEKARYAQETVTKEDAKEAARLSGRLGR